MTLEEYPTLQALNTEACELQQKYDEVRMTTCTITAAQHPAKLQEVGQFVYTGGSSVEERGSPQGQIGPLVG